MAQEGNENPVIKALTMDDVNVAIGARLKQFQESFSKSITSTLETQLSGMMEKLKPADTQPPPPASGDTKGLPPEFEQRLKQMELEAKAAKTLVEKERSLREAAEQKQAAQEQRALLQSALVEAKIRPEMVEPAMAYLGSRLARDADGGVRWRADDGLFQPINDGVKNFLGTPTGMAFMPPRDVKGSGGSTGSSTGAGGKTEYSPADLGAMLSGRG
jgi:hypothetical protein